MKLLIVTCLKEDREKVAGIFEQAKIKIFSVTETTGFKDDYPLTLTDNWFSSGGELFDSIFLFSFTTPENANGALALIKAYNQENFSDNPIRSFIVPVENHS